MNKNTLSNYGWIVIAVLVLSVMIALATPFGNYIQKGTQSTLDGLIDTNDKALFNYKTVLVGDVNTDGFVNATDATLLNRFTSGWNKDTYADLNNFYAADIDMNGTVDGTDSMLLTRYANKWSDPNNDFKYINTKVTINPNLIW